MRTPILANSFDLLCDNSLEAKAAAIVAAMTGNSNFPKPTPSIQDISSLLAAFNEEKEVLPKNKKRNELIRLLHSLAGYVSYIANGDQHKLKSSGFDITFEQKTPVQLCRPENLQIALGKNPGELQLSSSRVVGAIFYNFQYTIDPITSNSLWISHIEAANNFTFKNLQKGKKYWCRVGAVGMNDKVMFSDAVVGIIE